MSDYVWVIEIVPVSKLYRDDVTPFDKVFVKLEDAFDACQYKYDNAVRRNLTTEEREINEINKDLVFKRNSVSLWVGIGDIVNFNIQRFSLVSNIPEYRRVLLET